MRRHPLLRNADAVLHERNRTMNLKKHSNVKKLNRIVFFLGISILCLAFCACDGEQDIVKITPTVQPSPTAVELSPTLSVTPGEVSVSGSTPTPTQAQENTPTPTPTPDMSPTPSATPSPTPTVTPSLSPTATPSPTPTEAPPEPYFENLLVEAAVREAVGNPDRVLMAEDFETVTVLNLSECGLNDVSFLSEFVNLQELDLSWNNLSDCTSLPELKHLTKLDLSYNFISEIQVLSSYTELTELSLRANNLEWLTSSEEPAEMLEPGADTVSASVFSELVGLRRLDLSYNILTDVSELAELTALEYLNLEKNRITDFSAIEFVPELIR